MVLQLPGAFLSSSREAKKPHPPGAHRLWPVHSQPLDAGPTDGRATLESRLRNPQLEVLGPVVSARVEQRHYLPGLRVGTLEPGGLAHVARTTGERQITQLVGAAVHDGDDVLDLEFQVEDHFRRQAVLAAMARPGGDGRI